jgi:hypothetical protein
LSCECHLPWWWRSVDEYFVEYQSEEQSSEEIAEAEKTLAEAAARRKSIVVATPAGDEVAFEVFYENKIKTNGGWMYDILVSKDDKETRFAISVFTLDCMPFPKVDIIVDLGI